jgi:hypothetical protein
MKQKTLLLRRLIVGVSLFGVLLSSFACRGKSALTSENIEGFTAGDTEFAFFGFAEGKDIDIDGDNNPDTQAVVTIIFSNRKTICKDFGNNNIAQNEDLIDDMVLIVANARILESGLDRSPLTENDIIVRNEANDSVNVRFKARKEGQTITTAQSPESSELVELHLLGPGGDRLAGTIEANVDFFNDAIQADDTAKISGYFAARHCKALDAFALDGGL